MARTGAKLLVETLEAAGVRYLFSLSGNQILSIYDAAIERGVRIIHTRHEAAAVHMADGWGRLTEEPGVAIVTAGPGHCNALSALFVASMAESPLLLLSGHCPSSRVGQGAFQEMDQVAAAAPVTKAAWKVEHPETLEDEISRALAIARGGRPGPVHVSLPQEVLEASLPTSGSAPQRDLSEKRDPVEWCSKITQALDLLHAAEYPLILAGAAMSRPQRWIDVKRLSEATGVPALPMDSPRGINDPALRSATYCFNQADVVLLAGKKLDHSLRFGGSPFQEGIRFIQLEWEEQGQPNGQGFVLTILGDPGETVREMAATAENSSWPATGWRDEVETARNSLPPQWTEFHQADRQPIHPAALCSALRPFLSEGGVFVSDGGEFGQWAQAVLDAAIRLINGPSGAIGSSLPMALAAKLIYPERNVFALMGDGTFGYHALELDTALRYQIPVVAIVGNDARWNAEYQLQIQHYGEDRAVGCGLLPSRYDRLAEALGCHGEFVQHIDELTPALERAVASDRPSCVNVAIEGARAPTFRS